MPKLSSRARLLVVLAAPWVAFALLELGLRAGGFDYPPQEIALQVWNPERDAAMERGDDFHAVDPELLWAPAPGRPIGASGEAVNADGMRGPLVPRARTPDVLRVALLGESAVFGMDVAWDDCVAARLARVAAERGVALEVLDAAVVGFTAWQGLARWERDVRPFAPDVVVVGFGAANERHPCKVLPDEEKLAALAASAGSGLPALGTWLRRESRAVQLVARLSDALKPEELRPEAERRALQEARVFDRDEGAASGAVDWPGRRRVSLESFGRALLAIGESVRSSGARCVLVAMPRHVSYERDAPVSAEYSAQIADVAERHDLPLLDLRGAYRADVDAGADPAAWFLPKDRLHLSPAGHQRFAEALLPFVLEAAGR